MVPVVTILFIIFCSPYHTILLNNFAYLPLLMQLQISGGLLEEHVHVNCLSLSGVSKMDQLRKYVKEDLGTGIRLEVRFIGWFDTSLGSLVSGEYVLVNSSILQ